MLIQYGKKHDDWHRNMPRSRYYMALMDDEGDCVLVDDSVFDLDHARRAALQAGEQLACAVWCADCERPVDQCECLEVELPRPQWEVNQ